MPIATHNRISHDERSVSLIWQQLLGEKLATEEGEGVRIIYPGRISGDSGPDFRDAVIKVGCNLVKGDVEIHSKSSHWYSHKHHTSVEYNNVILHVVGWHDCSSAITRQDGKLVPQLCLSTVLQSQGYLMPYHQLPCSPIMNCIDRQTLMKLLHAAGEQRFKQKAAIFQVGSQQEDVRQVFWKSWLRALGYSKNTKPFEELASRVPLKFIESIEPRGSLVLKQAWLLGTAGLLPSQRLKGEPCYGEETRKLERVWRLVDTGAETMKESDWNFSHIYPNNSPVRRIVAQSQLLQRYCRRGLLDGMLQLVKETNLIAGHCILENGLIVFSDGYWQDHFDFGAKTKISALLGRGKADEIIVNVILPFVFSCGEPELKEKALHLYLNYPKLAENGITRHMTRQLCLDGSVADFTTCQQQGLIHIFRNYCKEGKCNECSLSSRS